MPLGDSITGSPGCWRAKLWTRLQSSPNDSDNQKMSDRWYPPLSALLSNGGTAPNGYPYCVNGSASDPDGDGWGSENSASRVGQGSAADH